MKTSLLLQQKLKKITFHGGPLGEGSEPHGSLGSRIEEQWNLLHQRRHEASVV